MPSFEELLEQLVERAVERAFRRVMGGGDLQPDLLTLAEAGQLAKRAPKTVGGWVKAGDLKRYGQGRPLVSRKELLELLSEPTARARPLERVPSAEAEVRRLVGRTG